MEWTELKDWKFISFIATLIGGIIAWFTKRPRESAETIKARAEAGFKRAETKKLNRENEETENKLINDLRSQLNEARDQVRRADKKIEKLERMLNIYSTFQSILKDKK